MAPPDWTGFARRLDGPMLDAFAGPAPAADAAGTPGGAAGHGLSAGTDADERIFVCGPSPFMENAASLLVARGHAPGLIHTERFGPS